MAAVIIGNPTTESPTYLGSIEVTGVMPVGSTPPNYSGSIEVPGAIPIGNNPINRGNTIIPTYYTKTQLQTSGQSEVHWGNLTNVPAFSTTLADLTDVDLTGLANGDIIKYNSTSTKWEAVEDETYTDADAVAAIKGDADWNASDWDTAYGWGNHSGMYDTIGTASGLLSTHNSTFNHGDIANGQTAFNWGNHASAGYITSAPLASYVPYTGATSDVNLGTRNLSTTGVVRGGIIRGTSTTARTTVAKVVTIAGYTLTAGDTLAITFTDGFSVANATLSVNGGSAIAIRVGGVAVTTALLSVGAGVSFTLPLYYDGTHFYAYGSSLNTDTTYTEITTAEIDAGSASTLRSISGRRAGYIIGKCTPIAHATNTSNPHGVTISQVGGIADPGSSVDREILTWNGITGDAVRSSTGASISALGHMTVGGDVIAYQYGSPSGSYWDDLPWEDMPYATASTVGGIKVGTGLTIDPLTGILIANGDGVTYPAAGIPLSTGTAWGTSITDNSANWNTAYSWGNHSGLYSPIAHATNTNNPHSVTATQVGLGNVTNESKATMFSDPTFSGYNVRLGSYTTLARMASGEDSVFGHNIYSDSSSRLLKQSVTGYYGAWIRMYYNGGIYFGTNPNAGTAGDTVSDPTGTTNDKMVITNAGNVGIGTTSPDTLLHIYNNTSGITNQLTLNNANTTVGYDGSAVFFKGYHGSLAKIIGQGDPQNSTGGDLVFQTYSDNTTVTGQLVINRLGNVGIGTVTPSLKLEVDNTTGGQQSSIGFTPDSTAHINNISGKWYGNIVQAIKFHRGGDATGGFMSFWTTPESGSLTERLRILSSGNVGIGTTSPFAKVTVPSGSSWNGMYAFEAAADSNSRRWWIHTDAYAYGDFVISTESSKQQGATPTTARLTIGNTGIVSTTSDIRASGDIIAYFS